MAYRSRKNRKSLLGVGFALAFFMTAGFWQINLPAGNASPLRKGAIFDIIPTSSTPITASAGTFVLTGKVYPFRSVDQSTCALKPEVDPVEDQVGTWTATVVVTPPIPTINSSALNSAALATANRFQMHHTLVFDSLPGILEVHGINGLIALNGDVTPANVSLPNGPTTGPSEIQTITGGSFRFEGLDGSANIRPYCGPPVGSPIIPFRFERAFCLGVSQAVN
ncbi:MAG: hypothetical protein ACLGJB_10325 [Blastocatellia bacterium]